MVDLSTTARKEGILSLESFVLKEENLLLKTGLSLVVDGTDPETITLVLKNLIISSKCCDARLLQQLIYAQGLLLLQQGESPTNFITVISSMLGESHFDKAMKETNKKLKGVFIKIQEFLEEAQKLNFTNPPCELEQVLAALDYRSVQRVLYGFDIHILSIAIANFNPTTLRIVLDNMSFISASEMIDNLHFYRMAPKEDVSNSQKKVLDYINELNDSGEIIIHRYKA